MAKEVVRNINININGKQVVNSLTGITNALRQTNKDLRNLNKNDADYTEQLKVHNARITELKARQKEFTQEIYGTSKALKEGKKEIESGTFSIQNFMSALMSGDVQGLHEEFKLLGNGIGNVTKQALAFIATPIGAAITVLTGIVLATKYWYDYNVEMEKSTRLIQQFTGLTNDALETATVRTRTFAEVADEDLKTVANTVNAVAKAYKIDYLEALDLVEKGYVRGGKAAEDFFDNASEYVVHFKNAGYTANEFFSILEEGAKSGTYKDKLVDTVKEMDLRLKEMTKSATDALTTAFGSEFTNNLANGIKTGTTSTKEALQLINAEADKVGLNFQQKQTLVADVFGAMGEDAGGFENVLNAINEGLENTDRKLTDVEEAQLATIAAQDEMNQAFADLFHTTDGGFSVMKSQLMEWVYKSITTIINGVIDTYNWFVDLYNSSNEFAGVMNTIGAIGKFVFNNLSMGIKNIGEGFKGLGSIIEAIFKGDFSAIPSLWADTMDKMAQNTLETAKKSAKNFVDAWNGENPKLKKIERNTVENVVTNTTENEITGGGNSGNKGKTDKQLEAEKKKQEALKKLFEKGEKEIDEILRQSREARDLARLNGLQREEAQITNKYAKEIEKYKEHTDRIKELEAARDAEIEEARRQRSEEYRLQAEELEEQNRIAKEEADYERRAEAAASEEERQYILLEKAREIALIELEIEREKELAKVEAVEGAEELKNQIRQKYAYQEQKIRSDFDKAERTLRSQQVDWTKLTEEQKLAATKNALNGAAEAFNEGSGAWKATKIAETVITTYQSATSAFNSLSGIPIVGPALGAAAAALAVVTGLKNVQKISSTPLQKIPTHYYGGYTGDASGQFGGDEYGKFTGAVHANEWVSPAFMTQSPRYAPIIDWLDNERQMQLNGVAGSSANPFFDHPVFSLLTNAVMQFNQNVENGIVAKSYFGYEELEKMDKLNRELQQTKQNAIISE